MKRVSQKYAENKPWRQKFVGCKVFITDETNGAVHGVVEGFEGTRAFQGDELEDEEIEVSFKHTPANEHNKRDQWWMHYGGDRVALSNEARQIMYARLDLDYPAFHVSQKRRIPKSSLPLFTDRTAARQWMESNASMFEPTHGHRRQFGTLA